MLTPKQWNDLYSSEATGGEIKSYTSNAVYTYLLTLSVGDTVTTENIIEALYPRAVAEQSLTGDKTRTAMYGVVAKLAANELSDCCEKGEVSGKYFGKPKRPWIWFRPPERTTCPHCGQTMLEK